MQLPWVQLLAPTSIYLRQVDAWYRHPLDERQVEPRQGSIASPAVSVRGLGFLCDCYSVFSIDWRLKRMKNRLFN